MPVAPSPTLGATCGGAACTKTFCVSTDPDKCGGNALTRPCVGRPAATYCTQQCNADSDCASSAKPMTCLTSCPEYSELAGYCWTREDAEFLKREVCPSSAPPDGGAPAPDASTSSTPEAGVSPPDGARVDGPPSSMPDSGPAPTGEMVPLKFCHSVRRNDQVLDLTLEIDGKIRLQAKSDECAPIIGQACPLVPTTEFHVRLLEGTTMLAEDNVQLDPGFEYFIKAETDGDGAFIGSSAFPDGALCRDTNPLTLPRSAGARAVQRSRVFRLPWAAGGR
jgi:hypothetical protein